MSKRSKTDLLVRQRFQNPLPPPAFPPKLLTIKTDPERYASYDFLVPLCMERATPMIVDQEGGMHLDQNLVPGYWQSASQGRSGNMAPDMTLEPAEMDEDDLALLVDPPGVNTAAAGLMPHVSGASLDLVGSGRVGVQNANPAALEKRKKDVAWLQRTDYTVQAKATTAAKREALVTQLTSQPSTSHVGQSLEQQIEAITATFAAIETPLSLLRHPTKAHLEAVESYDILPDEALWANQYALFKFSENPMAIRNRALTDVSYSTANSADLAVFRPITGELDENGAIQIAYYLPEDAPTETSYGQRRRQGKDVDSELMQQQIDRAASTEGNHEFSEESESVVYAFRHIRDYDAIRRETRNEFVFRLSDGDNEKRKAAYFIPISSQNMLRKRRVKTGSSRDYEYWGGALVTVGGASVLPEDEMQGRKDELSAILPTPTNGIVA